MSAGTSAAVPNFTSSNLTSDSPFWRRDPFTGQTVPLNNDAEPEVGFQNIWPDSPLVLKFGNPDEAVFSNSVPNNVSGNAFTYDPQQLQNLIKLFEMMPKIDIVESEPVTAKIVFSEPEAKPMELNPRRKISLE